MKKLLLCFVLFLVSCASVDNYVPPNANSSGQATLDKNVSLIGGFVKINLYQNQKYPIWGIMSVDGVKYTLVKDPLSTFIVMVAPDGSLRDKVAQPSGAGNSVSTVIYSLTISDPTARFTID